ncbi:MAG: septum formation initiator family protein [Chlorobi bacterium]|nr:septum formation initiator family protein [Chlorobiota bacterium]
MQKLVNILLPIIKNKYFLTLFVFVLWISFFDNNNLVDRLNDMNTLKQLEKDKMYYQEHIEQDRDRINELKTNNENLEKFAREEYLMKKKNEDVFYIVEEK